MCSLPIIDKPIRQYIFSSLYLCPPPLFVSSFESVWVVQTNKQMMMSALTWPCVSVSVYLLAKGVQAVRKEDIRTGGSNSSSEHITRCCLSVGKFTLALRTTLN